MNKQRKHNWFDKPSVFLISIVLVLLFLILTILLIIGNSVSRMLEETAIDGLITQQKALADDIDDSIIGILSSQAVLMDPQRFEDAEYRSLFFKEARKAFTGLRAISITIYNQEDGSCQHFADMGFSPTPIDSGQSTPVVFDDDYIISIGKAYLENLHLFTLQPVYISFYGDGRVYVVSMELNISEILFNSIQTKSFPERYYSLTLHDSEGALLEASGNYPRKHIAAFADDNALALTNSDRLQLAATGIIRKDSNFVHVMTRSGTGYIIAGELDYSYINDVVRPMLFVILATGIIGLAAILLLSLLFVRYRKLEENQIQMQIDTIRAKLDPHFLFNALNSMAGLASEGRNDELFAGMRNLSSMMRSTLELGAYINLFDELEFIRSYIDVQYIRYGDVFEYSCNVEDESLLYQEIPKFTIQPIIENCFVHAVALVMDRKTKIHISLTVHKRGKDLLIDIENDGDINDEELAAMIEKLRHSQNGGHQKSGLSLINRELKLLYGKKYGLLISKTDGKLMIEVCLPLNR